MFQAMDISVSGMVAQRVRLDAASSNIANMSTQINEAGQNEPYKPRFVVLETDPNQGSGTLGAEGVKVQSVEIENVDPIMKYEPNNPLADPVTGMVAYPNINLMQEFVDALEATRAYEANVGVVEVTKEMTLQSLKIVA